MAKTAIDEKIARLEAELKNAKAAKTQAARKERNSQLMAFGIGLEMKYKSLSPAERERIKAWFNGIDERNKARALEGFARLDGSLREISSEPPADEA